LRTDQYGGSIERKIRFAVEVASAVADEIGAGRTGIRISPGNTFNDIRENDVYTVYGSLIRELSRLALAYMHVAHMGDEVLLQKIRGIWPGVLVLNRGGADLPARIADIDNGTADVIAVASMSLANPDLVERIKTNAPPECTRPFDVLRRRDKRLHGLPKPRDDGTSMMWKGYRE
jgi:N-ethylmaleimide reductase